MIDLLHNNMLMAAICSWAAAQILKTIIYAITNKTLDVRRLVGDGGMPSGHSATVTALATAAAVEHGLSSPEFAIAGIVAIVVMHDATGVRLEAGKHAELLNQIVEYINADIAPEKKLKEFLGHTMSQVVFGAILGFVVALIFCLCI